MKLCPASLQHHDSNCKRDHVLLKAHVPIAREKNIELILRERQQVAIGNSTPAHLLDRGAIISRKGSPQTPVQTFVNEDAHAP